MTPLLARFLRIFTLERGILAGLALGAGGFALAGYSVILASAHLGAIDPVRMMRVIIPSVTLMLVGAETVFASFLLGFIDVRTGDTDES
jgi:hypothetical protein